MSRFNLNPGRRALGLGLAIAGTLFLAKWTESWANGHARLASPGAARTEAKEQSWRNTAARAAQSAATSLDVAGAVSEEDIAALANEVNLDRWMQVVATIPFQDRSGSKKVVSRERVEGLNAVIESWVNVYSPRDPVGQAGNWNTQILRAQRLQEELPQTTEKRWLELFILAGRALERGDSAEFAQAVSELKRDPVKLAVSPKKSL